MAIIKKFRIKSFKNLNPIVEFNNVSLSYGNRLIFDELPKQCTISIYTITGELVDVIDHGDENNLDVVHEWDLKNENGEIVAPGLYIFVVEAGSGLDPRIGKFVIIK